ncbi:MAG: hypothetical protein PGN08_09120 [Sphingomonas taxi]
MAFDLAASLRRLKPDKRTAPLALRPDTALPFVGDEALGGPPLLLDTTVYIDVLQGRAPAAVKDLLRVRQIHHSAVALGELTHAFGRLDPGHAGSNAAWSAIAATIADIPAHRLAAPGIGAFADAGIVTGIIARLRGLAKADRQPLMNDALLFLQALDSGCTLLSRNIGDMDLIDQLVPSGRLLLYRQAD